MAHGTLLLEAQRVERAIGFVRWGAAALALLLGPSFPNLSTPGVYALGGGLVLYNLAALRVSRRATTTAQHARVAEAAFAGDLLALSLAMLLFSSDPLWTTYFIGTLVITGAAFRFGSTGTIAATVVLSVTYLAVAIFRDIAFGYTLEPQRAAFNISLYLLTAILIDRVLQDAHRTRREREELIGRLERRVTEDAALTQVMRIVATVPLGDDVVPAVLRASREVFRFDRATVFVADEASGQMRVVHRLVPDAEATHAPPRLRIGEGVLGAAMAGDGAMLVPDLMADPRYVPGDRHERPRSVILVPLRVGGRPVAAFSLSRDLPDDFGPDDARLAETIASLIGQVLENQRLFGEARDAEALRAMDKLKDEFLATVSHELRTPLTVVSGALELLGRDHSGLDDRSAHLVDQAARHAKRLNHSVEDLLDLAQLQEAKIVLVREFIACDSLLREVAATYELMAAQRGQRLRVECPPEVPPALVDHRRMLQILGNLVTNAIRYSPEGSDIAMRAGREDGDLRFAVEDEGPGIPREERERIFDKFYRLSANRETSPSGTGLGLTIAKTLVELHGGRIWVEQSPAGGSAFVVAIRHEDAPVPVEAIG